MKSQISPFIKFWYRIPMAFFSFVHAADLHLDSPFAGITASAPHIQETMMQASFQAWRNLVDICLGEQVDFLLVAGDVFDWEDRSLRAQLAFRDGCAQLAKHGIQTFVVHGNHDPLQGRFAAIDWPEGVHIFGHANVETRMVEREGSPVAAVSGISYEVREEKRNLAAMFASREQTPGIFSIGLLHANLGGTTGHAPYAPCTMKDLTWGAIDYWALGHVHTRRIVSTEPHVVYPGNTQGRSFTEQGKRGAYVVHVQDGQVAGMDFRPVDAVRFLSVELPIGPYSTIDALVHGIVDALETQGNSHNGFPLVCRATLTGRGDLYGQLIKPTALDHILENVRDCFQGRDPFVRVESIKAKCQPAIDMESLLESDSILSMVLRDMEALSEAPQVLEEISKQALAPLFGHSVVGRALPPLDEDDLLEMLSHARRLCMDLLDWEDS